MLLKKLEKEESLFNMLKTILILGASGNVGSDLVTYLSKDYKIIALFRDKKKINLIKNENVKIVIHDLKKVIKLKDKVDYVINCIVTHSFSIKNKLEDYISSNILSPHNMIKFSSKNKVKLIINLSSVSIYGSPNQKKISENTPINQFDLLAITKIFGEKCLEYQKINYVNLRLPGILCKKFNKQRPWLNTLIYKIKKNLNVNVYDSNFYFNNVITTFDIYKLIDYLINNKFKLRTTFNYSASKPVKLKQIIKKIKFFYKSSSKIKNVKNDKSFIISNKKLEKKLGFKPNTTFNIIEKYLFNIN